MRFFIIITLLGVSLLACVLAQRRDQSSTLNEQTKADNRSAPERTTIPNANAEVMLSETENACNPIPSPDGSVIAYVRTGRWEKGSGGLGRSNLRSEVMVMTYDYAAGQRGH